MNAKRMFLSAVLLLTVFMPAYAGDWPQLQQNAARTGRTADEVAPPFRARWIWLGPALTLRNALSQAGWTDDLKSRSGYSYPVPAQVPQTIAESVQPVVAAGRVFFGTMDGPCYAVDAADGSTLWSYSLPAGTLVTAAVAGECVIFAGVEGTIAGVSASGGSALWTFTCRKAVTSAPCVEGGRVIVADHAGFVYALDPASGMLLWEHRLPAPVVGGVAIGDGALIVPAEDLFVYSLAPATGALLASHRVRGQSFRLTYPVVFGGYAWVQSVMVPAVGSEYDMETLMTVSGSPAVEESNIYRWLQGDSTGGIGADASPDWKHFFALRTDNLAEDFVIPCGPVEGCGLPAESPCVDNQGRVLSWWKTRFPTLTHTGAFGTNYSLDISAVNKGNGKRESVGSGFSNMWPGPETDNLYAMSVGGSYLWLRQGFRGTQTINLSTSAHRLVSAEVRNLDGGTFAADIVYVDQPAGQIKTSQPEAQARTAAAISGTRVYWCERFGLTCVEHAP